jgi:hypothetical protein
MNVADHARDNGNRDNGLSMIASVIGNRAADGRDDILPEMIGRLVLRRPFQKQDDPPNNAKVIQS